MFGVLGRKLKAAKQLYDAQGMDGVIRRLRRRGADYPGYLNTLPPEFAEADMEGRFSYLAKSEHWGGKGESVSGHGSTIEHTRQYRADLAALLREMQFTSMLDAPCGDFNWMARVLPEVSIDYTGGDIVAWLVERNRDQNPGVRFIHFDITKDPFPAVDVWHCRHCLFHLSYKDIAAALTNFQRSGVRHVLLTSDEGDFHNRDCETGDFRYLDFRRAPFSFPAPIKVLKDGEDRLHRMCLWEREALASATERFASVAAQAR